MTVEKLVILCLTVCLYTLASETETETATKAATETATKTAMETETETETEKEAEHSYEIEEGIFECVSDEVYQENRCNFCTCKSGELMGCSRSSCDNLPFYDMAKKCTIGRSWNEGCNACTCAAQYGTVCTIKQCLRIMPNANNHKGRKHLNRLKRTQEPNY